MDVSNDKLVFYEYKDPDHPYMYISLINENPSNRRDPKITLDQFVRTSGPKGVGKLVLLNALKIVKLLPELKNKKTIVLSSVPHNPGDNKAEAQARLNAYYTQLGFTDQGDNNFYSDIDSLIENLTAQTTGGRKTKKLKPSRGTYTSRNGRRVAGH
jgi:hypothetical protein